MSTAAVSRAIERITKTPELKPVEHTFHMSLLAWLQVISIVIAALYFLISHDATTSTKLEDQHMAIASINNKLDSLDKKSNDNAEKLAEIVGKLDLIVYKRNKGKN